MRNLTALAIDQRRGSVWADPATWWLNAGGPQWNGHTWRSMEESSSSSLVAEARLWADAPNGVLYIHGKSLRAAYAFAVAVSQRATENLKVDASTMQAPLAVGLLDELSIPDDPDPDYTASTRRKHPLFSSVDTREAHISRYAEPLRTAPLALLRLPQAGDPDFVLDQVADYRRSWQLPTLVASAVPPSEVASAFGQRIAWRLGFAEADGSPIGLSTADAAVLNLDAPPL